MSKPEWMLKQYGLDARSQTRKKCFKPIETALQQTACTSNGAGAVGCKQVLDNMATD